MPVPATHCQPWLLLARSPSTRWSQEVAGAAGPLLVQVLHQERRHDHAHAVVHVRLRVQLPHAGIDDREAGAAELPGLHQLRGVGAVVVAHPLQLRLEVLARRLGPVPEDVGVELAPRELVGVPAGGFVGDLREVGQQGARVDAAVLQVGRHPAGAVGAGHVAPVGVVGQALVAEPAPRRAGRGLAGGREVGVRGRRRCVVGADAGQPGDLPRSRVPVPASRARARRGRRG